MMNRGIFIKIILYLGMEQLKDKKVETQGAKKPSEMYVLKRYDSVVKQLEEVKLANKQELEELHKIKQAMINRYITKTF